MLNKIKSVVEYLISKKDLVTTIAGFIAALTLAINDYFVNNQKVSGLGLLTAIGLFIVAYFTGKGKK